MRHAGARMHLAFYGLGTISASFPWSAFCAAFAPLEVTDDPVLGDTHYILQHAERPVRFYAPVLGMLRKTVSSVDFEFEDVRPFIDQAGRPDHPLWTGLYDLLGQWDCLLRVTSIPMGETVIVGEPAALRRLPSWVGSDTHVFVAESRAEFDALFAEAWELIARVDGNLQPRLGWADAIEHDAAALAAFSDYLAGKRGKVPRYTWCGKPIKIAGSRSNFLERYGVWVDWRSFDDSIVRYFAERLREPSLRGDLAEDGGIRITFGAKTKDLSLDHIGPERYQTIRGLNDILSGAYEIRGVRKEMQDDTHCFLIAPMWLWRHLEEHDAKRLDQKIKRIDLEDGFVTS
jgi:hypothetical protein